MRTVQLVAFCKTCSQNGCEHVLQEYSKPTAYEKGTLWSTEELLFVRETTDCNLSEVARALGRTYYAVGKIRSHIKSGRITV
jgi:hypothetical protein